MLYAFLSQVIEYDEFFDMYQVNFLALTKRHGYFKWPCRLHEGNLTAECKRCDNSWELPTSVIKKLSEPKMDNGEFMFENIDEK